MWNIFTRSAKQANAGNIQQMSALIVNREAHKPNGTSQAGRRRRAKRDLSHGGRTRGRIR